MKWNVLISKPEMYFLWILHSCSKVFAKLFSIVKCQKDHAGGPSVRCNHKVEDKTVKFVFTLSRDVITRSTNWNLVADHFPSRNGDEASGRPALPRPVCPNCPDARAAHLASRGSDSSPSSWPRCSPCRTATGRTGPGSCLRRNPSQICWKKSLREIHPRKVNRGASGWSGSRLTTIHPVQILTARYPKCLNNLHFWVTTSSGSSGSMVVQGSEGVQLPWRLRGLRRCTSSAATASALSCPLCRTQRPIRQSEGVPGVGWSNTRRLDCPCVGTGSWPRWRSWRGFDGDQPEVLHLFHRLDLC